MSVILDTQKALRSVQKLRFCYLCGGEFAVAEDLNSDHVPPSGLFEPGDRDFPLILQTHSRCNNKQSSDDQVIAQLVGRLHGRKDDESHDKLTYSAAQQTDGSTAYGVGGFNFHGIIRRWISGFHTALYHEYLPMDAHRATNTPLPEGDSTDGVPVYVPVAEAVPAFVEELKRNRAVGSLDRVVCRNGKCVYECVWTQADGGQWMCVYALDLYGWIRLGDVRFGERGCVGVYRRPEGGTPRNASCATRLHFEVSNFNRLDPFGS